MVVSCVKCTQTGCGKSCSEGVAFFKDGAVIDEVLCPECFHNMVETMAMLGRVGRLWAVMNTLRSKTHKL